ARRANARRSEAPVVNVTLDQAAAYCAFANTRLPTDKEWLAAAQADCLPFPWGKDPFGGNANCIASERGYTLHPPGTSPGDVVRGVYDLLGNAEEWTADGTVRGSRFCGQPLGTRGDVHAQGYDSCLGIRCMRAP
ncbi:MAG TPA: SUMF1/EgtB/PvdO family nonheme iron enzyme, partial [Polyangiaceae bacterium]